MVGRRLPTLALFLALIAGLLRGVAATAGDTYTYDFIINVAQVGQLGPHCFYVKLDGVLPSQYQFTWHRPPDRRVSHVFDASEIWRELRDRRDRDHRASDEPLKYSAWNDKMVGEKIFSVASATRISSIEISCFYPKYTPGWLIMENGVEVYRETANRGDGDIPYPATYTHTWSRCPNGDAEAGSLLRRSGRGDQARVRVRVPGSRGRFERQRREQSRGLVRSDPGAKRSAEPCPSSHPRSPGAPRPGFPPVSDLALEPSVVDQIT